jgi:hypothetical protein
VNDVASYSSTTSADSAYVHPYTTQFNNPKTVFASNARTLAIVAKFTF